MDNRRATLELETKPVGRLLMQYALPAIIAMTASSLYNMVDSIFIGQGVGALAISGLAVTFPFMNLSAAFGAAIGVGASTLISVKLGQKDYRTAVHILGNTMTLNVVIGLVFCVVSMLFLDHILLFFGGSEQTIPYARDYMQVILLGNVVTHVYFGMNAALRASGKPRKAMYATMCTVALNTLLDPLFIYGLGMGIRGAAWATVLSQAVAMVWQLSVFCRQDELVHLEQGTFAPRWTIVRNIVGIGCSPFAMNACACLVVVFINNGLMRHGGDMAVGAYGIANRVAFIFVMVTMGINQGMQPIAGYNYGAGHTDRLMRVLFLSIMAATVVMTGGWVLAEFFTHPCARLFTSDEELTQLTVRAMRILMLVLPVVGYQMVITNFFQSIGKARVSIFLSLSRQLIFLLPLLVLLPRIWGVDGVWYAMPASDLCSAVVTAVVMGLFMKRTRRQQHN